MLRVLNFNNTNMWDTFGLDTPSNSKFSREHIRLFNNNFQKLFDIYKVYYVGETNKPLQVNYFRRLLVLAQVVIAKTGPT